MAVNADNPTAAIPPGINPDELAPIIRAFNEVTANLQRSHESLQAQVERLQHELAGANAQLQRSKRLAALGEMAAGIAHEVRNPLAAIQLYAAMLTQDLDKLALAEQADTARKIASAVRGLDAIVGDVLSFARDLSPRGVEVDAIALFDRAVDLLRPQIDAARVQVRIEVPDTSSLSPVIEADPDLLHQALVNLIRNAVDAMTPRKGAASGGGGGVLTLAVRVRDGGVVLTVRDTGPGIAPEHVERIFNPFFTTRDTGTGLGLAIVHRIIDAHGGAIAVRNDRGAVFEITLPSSSFSGRRVAALAQPGAPR